jgi:hypothetical protein
MSGHFDHILPSIKDFEKCDISFGEMSSSSSFAPATVAPYDPNPFHIRHGPRRGIYGKPRNLGS